MVAINGRDVETLDDSEAYRFRFALDAPVRLPVAVEAHGSFRWVADDCVAPPYRLTWRGSADTVFDATRAIRQTTFQFSPPVSLMSVSTSSDGGVFDHGTLTWRWRGASPEFQIGFEPLLADEHTDLFQGRYVFPLDYQWDHEYLDGPSSICEMGDLDWAGEEGEPDSMTADMRGYVESLRAEARYVLEQISAKHSLIPPGTNPEAFVLAGKLDLSVGLTRLNPVEERNLRYAIALLPILDVSRRPAAIRDDILRIRPNR